MSADGLEPRKFHNGRLSTDATDPERVRALARRLIRPMREEARACGYALAEHGSQARDIDLIAVPWTAEAVAPEDLARLLRHQLNRLYPVLGEVAPNPDWPRPHGRLCWAWWIRTWTYVDLSIMPPIGG
jgi:hypothetical protein